jgi:hypothetical protein
MAIQIPDKPNDDLSLIRCYAFNEPNLSMNDFVIIEDSTSHRQYFGQIASPQANLNRSALGPQDNATVNALEELFNERYAREVVVREVYYYQVSLLKDITDGQGRSIRRRPQIGSIIRSANQEEILNHLNLPEYNEQYEIGYIEDTDLKICLSRRTLFYQTLIAGATGSGKSNSSANYIAAALEMGFAVIVYDHKPDYQHLHLPNSEITGAIPKWVRKLDSSYYRLGGDVGIGATGTSIGVPASEFDPSVLAAVLFPNPSDNNQREEVEILLEEYETEKNQGREDRELWTLNQFFLWLIGGKDCITKPTPPASVASRFEGRQNSTYKAIVTKLRRRGRKPQWVDGGIAVDYLGNRNTSPNGDFFKTSSSQQDSGSTWFDPMGLLQPGQALVIRVSTASGGRDYGLFLNYMLRRVYELKDKRIINFPILHHIDEAQDIFGAGKQFASALGSVLSEGIRKGRSREIAFNIAVQSAAQVPDDILNNLNSRIVHRHNRSAEAQRALEKATDAQINAVRSFGPGEALVDLFGATAVMNAIMRQSPFQLTTEDLLRQEEQKQSVSNSASVQRKR